MAKTPEELATEIVVSMMGRHGITTSVGNADQVCETFRKVSDTIAEVQKKRYDEEAS